MKNLQEILNQEPVFLNNWKTKEDVISDFEGYSEQYPFNDQDKIHILFASYGTDNYSGQAWVLFEQDGKLYEVNGSHCSCYGLEGQWEPEEVNLDALEMRIRDGRFGIDEWSGDNFREEIIEFLGVTFLN